MNRGVNNAMCLGGRPVSVRWQSARLPPPAWRRLFSLRYRGPLIRRLFPNSRRVASLTIHVLLSKIPSRRVNAFSTPAPQAVQGGAADGPALLPGPGPLQPAPQLCAALLQRPVRL